MLSLGDRQDFRINLTNMSSERIQEIVHEELARIASKQGLKLDDLIKTQHYKPQGRGETGPSDDG